jgi:hypothetical protein
MFCSRSAVIAAALFLQSAVPSSALTNEEANVLRRIALQGGVSALTVGCGIEADGRDQSYQRVSDADRHSCATVVAIIFEDFSARGYRGTRYCPPATTTGVQAMETITNYIVARRPVWTERAVDVALAALMRAYPCSASNAQ